MRTNLYMRKDTNISTIIYCKGSLMHIYIFNYSDKSLNCQKIHVPKTEMHVDSETQNWALII